MTTLEQAIDDLATAAEEMGRRIGEAEHEGSTVQIDRIAQAIKKRQRCAANVLFLLAEERLSRGERSPDHPEAAAGCLHKGEALIKVSRSGH